MLAVRQRERPCRVAASSGLNKNLPRKLITAGGHSHAAHIYTHTIISKTTPRTPPNTSNEVGRLKRQPPPVVFEQDLVQRLRDSPVVKLANQDAGSRPPAKKQPATSHARSILFLMFSCCARAMGEATTPFVALARDGTDGQQTHADNSSQRRIPRVVWQTVRSRLGLSSSFNASWKLMVKANPGWTFNLVDNEDMERTVQSHAPTAALRAFQSINHAFGAARADFWRYLVLLSLGGVYFDADICINMPLDDFISVSDRCVLFSEPNVFPYDWNTTMGDVQPHTKHEQMRRYLRWPADGTRACGLPPIVVAQWFIAAEPGHPLLREAVELVTAQVQAWDDTNPLSREFDSRIKVLYLTGPSIWNQAIRNTISALSGCAERGGDVRSESEIGAMRINELDMRFHKSWFRITNKQRLRGYVASRLPAVPAIRYHCLNPTTNGNGALHYASLDKDTPFKKAGSDHARMPAATAHASSCEPAIPIADVQLSEVALVCDAVYRWVNPSSITPSIANKIRNQQRYRDNDELRFSMRSFAGMQGVRYLHTVAKGEPPSWLDVTHPRIFWWSETRLLNELRILRGITSPLRVFNSEPAKLAITRIPNLADRFLLVDDDYFAIPQRNSKGCAGISCLSTRIFFDAAGVPLHPETVLSSHRPIPMLRSAYFSAVAAESDADIERQLTSGVNRVVTPRAASESVTDPMVRWCVAMKCNGTARPLDMAGATRFSQQANGRRCSEQFSTPSYTKPVSYGFAGCNATPLNSEQSSPLALFFLQHGSPSRHSPFPATEPFFEEVWHLRPYLMTVNDDWPIAPNDYARSLVPFKDFLVRMYPQSMPWEIINTTSILPLERKHSTPIAELSRVSPGGQRASPGVTLNASFKRQLHQRHDAQLQAWRCNSSSDVLMLPRQAFDIPPGLLPLLSQLDAQVLEGLHRNDKRLSVEQLTASVTNLDLVDLDNTISFDPPPQAAADRRQLRVAEFNAGRGRHWCEIAAQVLRSPDLRAVDVWFLNEFDLGMARSEQLHTLRLLAYALGLNYAWGAEFVELTNGNAAEQHRTRGRRNRYGLHGNGLLSRWPLSNATIIRMPGMDALYHHNRSRPRDTAGGYEKRLGGRMSLFATADVEGTEVLLIATHAQTSWEMDTAHTGAASQLVRTHIANLDTIAAARGADPPLILLGGDTWPQTCEWVGLTGLVTDKGRTNWVNPRTSKVTFGARGLDDYICGRGFRRTSEPVRTVTVGCLAHTQACQFQFVLSDHIFVTVNVSWGR